MAQEQTWEEWVASRPEDIQKTIANFPPGEYRIKQGAPYGVTTPGSKVRVHSYGEDGTIGVIILAEDKSPEAIAHEEELGRKYNKTPEEIADIHSRPVKVFIDPKYMELIELYKIG